MQQEKSDSSHNNGNTIRLKEDFSSEIEARRQQNDIFKEKAVNQKSYIWKNYPSKTEGRMKTFSDKQREFVVTTSAL